jgi:adenosyl cobinamide kinase/adenosyl cobinamide phosphate guanylyltransferase
MDWSKASSHYQMRLKTALDVKRHALYLADVKTAGVKPELKQALIHGIEPVQRQLKRLEKGEFRIVVVGLEKSGKSTFVNAWLESDLLPTASERCTYTTTQIYSVTDETKQRLEVKAKSREEFNNYLEKLEQAKKESNENAKRAKEDLEIIEEHRASLDNVMTEGDQTFMFTRIDENIAHHLKRFVADVSVAHAIKEVRLYTTRLAETDGIVFCDAPGLDSGLGKHLEESKDILADCDAVICVQSSLRPSLVAHEQKLVGFVSEGDEAVGIAGKLFVFAGQIDLLGTANKLNENNNNICQEWDKRGKLPADHIVLGSAGAYMLFNGSAGDEINNSMGKADEVRRKLSTVKNIPDSASNEEFKEVTGIPAIRQRIKRYLNEERVPVLKKRCDEPIKRIMETADEIYRTVKQRFSENPDEVRRQEADRRNIEFQKWWGKRWSEIEPAVNRFFKEHFDPENREEETESVKQFRSRYQQLIQEGLSQLPSLDPKMRQDIFDKESRPVFDAVIVNDAWRKILYDNDINTFLHKIAKKLSSELLKDCQRFVDYMSSQLWDSSEVRRFILDEDETQLGLQLESGLRALFLRFARPVAESLIRGPLASDRRKEIVRKLGNDIVLLDNYYEGDDPALAVLRRYVKYGKSLIKNPVVRKGVLGINPPLGLGLELIYKEFEDLQPKQALSVSEVIEEVEGDIESLGNYLKDAVFTAAGFASYLSQELKRLRDQFASLSDVWAGVARNEYESENPKLLNELPAELKNQVFDVEISIRLKQLRLALEGVKVGEYDYI